MSTPKERPYTVELNNGGMRLEGPGMPEGNAEGFGFPAIHVSSKKIYANALAKCLSAAHAAGAGRAAQLEGALQIEIEELRKRSLAATSPAYRAMLEQRIHHITTLLSQHQPKGT